MNAKKRQEQLQCWTNTDLHAEAMDETKARSIVCAFLRSSLLCLGQQHGEESPGIPASHYTVQIRNWKTPEAAANLPVKVMNLAMNVAR